MEKPGKIKVTKKQAEQLVEHLQQYVRAAELREKDQDTAPKVRDCQYCIVFDECYVCPLDNDRTGVCCRFDPEYVSPLWTVYDSPATPKQILARARVLQERTNKWIYPWQIEDLSRVVKKEEIVYLGGSLSYNKTWPMPRELFFPKKEEEGE